MFTLLVHRKQAAVYSFLSSLYQQWTQKTTFPSALTPTLCPVSQQRKLLLLEGQSLAAVWEKIREPVGSFLLPNHLPSSWELSSQSQETPCYSYSVNSCRFSLFTGCGCLNSTPTEEKKSQYFYMRGLKSMFLVLNGNFIKFINLGSTVISVMYSLIDTLTYIYLFIFYKCKQMVSSSSIVWLKNTGSVILPTHSCHWIRSANVSPNKSISGTVYACAHNYRCAIPPKLSLEKGMGMTPGYNHRLWLRNRLVSDPVLSRRQLKTPRTYTAFCLG